MAKHRDPLSERKIYYQKAELMFYGLGYFISFVLGFLTLSRLEQTRPFPLVLKILFSLGLGLGLSGCLLFLFLLTGKINSNWCIAAHVLLCVLLLVSYLKHKKWKTEQSCLGEWLAVLPTLLLVLLFIGKASLYPLGGWDAWGIWNLKARFIFLGNENWTRLFDPALWETNHHYPLLLPLINVWIWLFGQEPVAAIPMITAIIFGTLTTALISCGIYHATRSPWSFLPSLLLGTLPFFSLTVISQYADILLAFFLLAAFLCFFISRKETSADPLISSILFIGLLSFTKDEGLVASFLLFFIFFYHVWSYQRSLLKKNLFKLGLCSVTAFLPTGIFYIFLRPENPRFINGLLSTHAPAHIDRLLITLRFLGGSIGAPEWSGLLIVSILIAILNYKAILQKYLHPLWIFLTAYLLIVIANYFINTHYEILWWLNTSANRILLALMPVLLWGIFSAFLRSDQEST